MVQGADNLSHLQEPLPPHGGLSFSSLGREGQKVFQEDLVYRFCVGLVVNRFGVVC